MKEIIRTLRNEEIDLLKTLIGKKLNYIHHQNEQFFDMTVGKVGLDVDGELYSIDTIYDFDDFLWPDESYAKLLFHKEKSVDDFVIEANPPLRYINDKINDTILDILLIGDDIMTMKNGMNIALFKHTKGIILCFDSHQIAFYLEDCLLEDFITVTKSTDAVSKINSLKDEWGNEEWSSGLSYRANREIKSIKNY